MQPPQFIKSQRDPIGRVTLLLIIINVGLFAWQIFSGISVSNPATIDAIRWGADYAPLTYLEEPIRIFTSTFFHFGLVHLMLNMWALYIFGNVAEKTFGSFYFLGLYLLAGIMGSLLSGYIDIRNTYELLSSFDQSLLPRVSAGASGAVMGLGGALAALSLLPPLPQQKFILDGKSLLIILALNLGMGFMIPGINNAAHIGGMLMGAVLALLWYMLSKFNQGQLSKTIILIVGFIATYLTYQYCLSLVQPIQPLWFEMIKQSKNQLGL